MPSQVLSEQDSATTAFGRFVRAHAALTRRLSGLLLERHGLKFEALDTTFFLGKATLARAAKPGLFTWRRELFRWMQRNSPAAAESFKLPPERVVELGTRISL